MKVKLLNLDGETLFLESTSQKSRKDKEVRFLNKISCLQKGVYFLKYDDDSHEVLEKLIVS